MTRPVLRYLTTILIVVGTAAVFAAGAQSNERNPEPLAADKLAIMELAARFENTFDRGDLEGHLATWAEEMSFESPFGNYDSKEAYREWVTGFSNFAQSIGGTRHLVTNHEIEVEGDTARMSAYLVILGQEGPTINFTTVFADDRLKRIDGQWKFVHRTLQIDQPVEQSAR